MLPPRSYRRDGAYVIEKTGTCEIVDSRSPAARNAGMGNKSFEAKKLSPERHP
jgi:hypothetical protein